MRRVALTGGIGTGKSYVTARLREAGVPVVDADVLARQAVAPDSPGLAAVVTRFGADILTRQGFLDRARLGEIVFRDEAARRDLEAIVHPVVRVATEQFFVQLPPDTPCAVADIPLLYETGRDRQFDAVIVVACDRATQLERVVARDGLSRAEAERRVAAQWPIAEKVARADYVIRTDGTFAETDEQVDRLLQKLHA
ncbi:MAG TPA: dephospho-CoA kinase [Vicinamibacterales bacterium]|nr:dephospho-CoA kinase [Vicinamibacterales bacterium]